MQKLFCFSNFLKKYVLLIGIFAVSAYLSHTNAFAQSLVSDETTARALKIAQKIKQDRLLASPPATIAALNLNALSPEKKLKTLRITSMNAVFYRNTLPQAELFSLYQQEAYKHNNLRDIKISKIFILQKSLQNIDLNTDLAKSNLQLLTEYRNDPDWFVAQRAALMQSGLHVNARNHSIALREAQTALSLIPNTLMDDVFEAQFETYDYISYLQIIQNNIDIGIVTTQQVIEKGQQIGRGIDGVGLLNNMIYAFNVWHEYDTAESLAKILLDITKKSDADGKSIAYFRYGEAQNNAKHYAAALKTLNIASENASNLDFKLGIEAERAIALAGLGNVKAARISFQTFDALAAVNNKDIDGYKDVRLRANALIALASNDPKTAIRIESNRSKNAIQRLLNFQSKGVQNLHANLQNNKERQAEREAGLKREAELKQKELIAVKRGRTYLLYLIGALFLIILGMSHVGVLRNRVTVSMGETLEAASMSEKAKKQFLSVMSHELRTPLNGIIGISDYIATNGETQGLRDQGNIILESGNNLLDLLTGILDMSQMDTDNLQIVTVPTDIHEIADELYKEWKAKIDPARVQLSCFVAENIPHDLMLDRLRVKQCLKNLISNGAKFTQDGRVHIHITLADQKGTREQTLSMIVADTGQGVTKEMQDKLFKPFLQVDASMTRAQGGAGIGLSVTRGLSRLMGGDITLETRVGAGSEFSMSVTTMSAEVSDCEEGTDKPVFKVQRSMDPEIDFTPAITLEEVQARKAERERENANNGLHGMLPIIDAGRTYAAPQYGARQVEHTTVESAKEIQTQFPRSEAEVPEFDVIGDMPDSEASLPSIEAYVDADIPQDQDVFDVVPALPSIAEKPAHRGVFSRRKERRNQTPPSNDELRGLNILVVEDMLVNQEVLRSLLEPVGCDVACADNGQEALDLMDNQIFDVILMDIRMPVMDGIDTTRAIRNMSGHHQNVPIIALTADAATETNAQCLAAGADVFLTKPIVVSELFSSIRFVRKKLDFNKQNSQSA